MAMGKRCDEPVRGGLLLTSGDLPKSLGQPPAGERDAGEGLATVAVGEDGAVVRPRVRDRRVAAELAPRAREGPEAVRDGGGGPEPRPADAEGVRHRQAAGAPARRLAGRRIEGGGGPGGGGKGGPGEGPESPETFLRRLIHWLRTRCVPNGADYGRGLGPSCSVRDRKMGVVQQAGNGIFLLSMLR